MELDWVELHVGLRLAIHKHETLQGSGSPFLQLFGIVSLVQQAKVARFFISLNSESRLTSMNVHSCLLEQELCNRNFKRLIPILYPHLKPQTCVKREQYIHLCNSAGLSLYSSIHGNALHAFTVRAQKMVIVAKYCGAPVAAVQSERFEVMLAQGYAKLLILLQSFNVRPVRLSTWAARVIQDVRRGDMQRSTDGPTRMKYKNLMQFRKKILMRAFPLVYPYGNDHEPFRKERSAQYKEKQHVVHRLLSKVSGLKSTRWHEPNISWQEHE